MLRADHQGSVLLLTLDRPGKRNALHPELIRALAEALAAADADAGVRAVVLTGAGPAFCAGLDLHHLLELEAGGRVAYMRSAFALFRRVYELNKPVIAAVNGAAMAGGFDLAAFCDLRFCSGSARFAQTEILLGLTQILYPLYEIVGLSRAKQLAMSGEPISAEEAYRIGLADRLYPSDELLPAAMRFAASLAERPPQALAATKRLSRELLENQTESAFTRMFATIEERLRSKEHQRAVETYVDRLRRADSAGRTR